VSTDKPRILKHADSARVVEAPVYDARIEAERIVAEARAQAQRIEAEAHEEAERVRAKAAAEGRERGLQSVSELLAGARAQAVRAAKESERELRVLAVRIAEKILGRELKLDAQAIADVAAEAVRLAGEARELTVRVHPDDLAALERGRPRVLERARATQIAFRADERIARGGCIVESELGLVDARLSTQLDAIERALKGE
jgi:type III secretion system HrpE/YscL family protein